MPAKEGCQRVFWKYSGSQRRNTIHVLVAVVSGHNAGISNVFALDGHGGLVSTRGAVGGVCRVGELLLLHHAQTAAGRLGAVVVGALEFGAGGEDNANALALFGGGDGVLLATVFPGGIVGAGRYR